MQKNISDFKLVAALMTLGYAARERIQEGKRVSFVFDWDDHMSDLENDFWNHRLDVDALTYGDTMKSVKAGIYQLQEGR